MKEQADVVFRVANNEEGKLFLALAKKYLNKDSYDLKPRGRTPDHKKLKKDKTTARRSCIGGTPLKYASNLGIYLIAKTPTDKECPKRVIGVSTIGTVNLYRQWYREQRDANRNMEEVKPRLEGVIKELNEIVKLG